MKVRKPTKVKVDVGVCSYQSCTALLSYAIPPGFTNRYIDSRLCAKTTNININVAKVIDIFGIEIANPLEAHNGYKTDERVIALIVNGVDNENTSQIVKERCTTLMTID